MIKKSPDESSEVLEEATVLEEAEVQEEIWPRVTDLTEDTNETKGTQERVPLIITSLEIRMNEK